MSRVVRVRPLCPVLYGQILRYQNATEEEVAEWLHADPRGSRRHAATTCDGDMRWRHATTCDIRRRHAPMTQDMQATCGDIRRHAATIRDNTGADSERRQAEQSIIQDLMTRGRGVGVVRECHCADRVRVITYRRPRSHRWGEVQPPPYSPAPPSYSPAPPSYLPAPPPSYSEVADSHPVIYEEERNRELPPSYDEVIKNDRLQQQGLVTPVTTDLKHYESLNVQSANQHQLPSYQSVFSHLWTSTLDIVLGHQNGAEQEHQNGAVQNGAVQEQQNIPGPEEQMETWMEEWPQGPSQHSGTASTRISDETCHQMAATMRQPGTSQSPLSDMPPRRVTSGSDKHFAQTWAPGQEDGLLDSPARRRLASDAH